MTDEKDDAPESVPTPALGELTYEGTPRVPTGKEITEEMGLHKQWYEESREVTLETLPAFLKHLTEDYEHDYGTICHAMSAAAVAAMRAVDKTDQGGITGFQAGCIMWEFIREWMQLEGPLSLRNFKDMLFPQYADKFETTISKDTWEWLQKEAQKNLDEEEPDSMTSERVANHWKSVVAGVVPFGWSVDPNKD